MFPNCQFVDSLVSEGNSMTTVSPGRRSLLMILAGTSAALLSGRLPAEEIALDDPLSVADPNTPGEGNVQLQAIGGLGVGHIQSTLGLIGVIADTVTREIYTHKQVEDLMNGTINGIESPKNLLRKLQDSNVSGDDAEFLDRMIGVFNALQREAKSLILFSKTRKPEDAALFEKARKLALRKLGELTQQEELVQPEPTRR
jgi:hypothetical protein